VIQYLTGIYISVWGVYMCSTMLLMQVNLA